MRAALLVLLSPGCVFVAAPGAPIPGRALPAVEPGQGELTAELDWGRNMAEGVEVHGDGTGGPASSMAPGWPGAQLALRQAIVDGVGVEARLNSTVSLPIPPVPIPNGFSVSPVVRLARPAPSLQLTTSPRFVVARGQVFTAFEDADRVDYNATGLDLPVTLSWRRLPWLAMDATAFGRTWVVRGRADHKPSGADWQLGEPLRWPALGGGLSGSLMFTPSVVRVGLGLGIEAAPNPAYGFYEPCEGCEAPRRMVLVPQGGVTLGLGWGGKKRWAAPDTPVELPEDLVVPIPPQPDPEPEPAVPSAPVPAPEPAPEPPADEAPTPEG